MRRGELAVGQHVMAKITNAYLAPAHGYYSDSPILCTVLDVRQWEGGNLYERTWADLQSGHRAHVQGSLSMHGRSVVLGTGADWTRQPASGWEGGGSGPAGKIGAKLVFLASPARLELPTGYHARVAKNEAEANERHLRLVARGMFAEAAMLHNYPHASHEVSPFVSLIDKLLDRIAQLEEEKES